MSAVIRIYALAFAVAFTSLCGCASTSGKWVTLRTTPKNPLSETLGLLTRKGPNPTSRTIQWLRRHNLEKGLEGDRRELLVQVAEIDSQEPNRENAYVMAELAYVGAKEVEQAKQNDQALELYGTAVIQSFRYLFDEQYDSPSNPYDPEFRQACDLYNTALEGTLRIVRKQGKLLPGTVQSIQTANHSCQFEIKLMSENWHLEDFQKFEFVSDYEIQGLPNHYHNYGLGVPLIAVRGRHEGMSPGEEFYPESLSFPVTAFLHVDTNNDHTSDHQNAVLKLYDPLEQSTIQLANKTIPLETDLSTPLAHALSHPSLDDTELSTIGLLKPEKAESLRGLYMLEPYDPEKIPVVMVHGLWSSPVTWMEMFNDLRSDPQIRKYYQFWFYLYPSGNPFWFSAAEMREDLAHLRQAVDPAKQYPALDQMVLVGHSMGGLVSKLQTIDSGNDFWSVMSERPFSEINADEEVQTSLSATFFFDPNPSIRRVITLGTPHKGSVFANDATRWLGRKLIRIPNRFVHGRNQLLARNPDYFRPNAPLDVTTSIDSLDPDSPLLPVLYTAQEGSWVKFHTVAGDVPRKGISAWIDDSAGDGVVALSSAHLDNASSEIVVPADHAGVHRHPQSILEVRRILMEHLNELRSFPYREVASATPREETNEPLVSPL